MKTQSQREALINSLLPALNDLQNTNDSGKPIYVAEVKKPITFNDLMKLSDQELEQLQKLVNSTRSAKQSQKKSNVFDSYVNPKSKYVISDIIDKPKNQIIL
jgi:hypothetical protein